MLRLSLRKDSPNLKILKLIKFQYKRANVGSNVSKLGFKESKGKIPVIARTGSNSTEEAISLTKYAEKIGANAALVVTPYYNKPTQEGLYQHFKAINDK